jgi:hypothetical protein
MAQCLTKGQEISFLWACFEKTDSESGSFSFDSV